MTNPLRKAISWFVPTQLEKVRGELGHDLEVNVHNGRMMLDTANVNYSFGSLQDVFDYAFTKTHLYDAQINSVLILGFGSGSVAELLLHKCNPEMFITGIEADKEVIRLAKKYFPVSNSSHVSLLHETAEQYVDHCERQFDLIILDVFIEDKVPASVQSTDFLRKVKSLMNKQGKIYINKMAVEGDPISLDDLEKNMRAIFRTVKPVKVHMGNAGNRVFSAQ